MNRKIIIIVIITLVVLIGIYEGITHISYTRKIDLPDDLKAGYMSSTTPDQLASTTPDVFDQTDPALLKPSSSTIDTSSWKQYGSPEIGYSISYPINVTTNFDSSGNVIFAFPKEQYFHWPLLDDVKVTISGSSTCPTILQGPIAGSSTKGIVGDYNFTRTESSDVAAGNIYRELAYDITQNDTCYHIDLLSHGANGAGLYVNDSVLIKQYEAQHDIDMHNLIDTFNAMVLHFIPQNTPAGIPEDQASPAN